MERTPVPVTIVTGFLGTGKTSLINHLLAHARGMRLALLVNDFGAINFDAQLIAEKSDAVVSLENGCICCSLADGLQAAVVNVLRWSRPPDAIVIETSGVSDPFDVVRTLSDREFQAYAPLDGVVTLVDAEGFDRLEGSARALAERQVAAADIVLLNKADLAGEARLRAAEAFVQSSAPGARALRARHGAVPPEVLMGMGGAALPPPSRFNCQGAFENAFESLLIELSAPVPFDKLRRFLSGLPKSVYRVKGFLDIAEKPGFRVMLQATGTRVTLTVGKPWMEARPRSQLIVIGARGGLSAEEMASRI